MRGRAAFRAAVAVGVLLAAGPAGAQVLYGSLVGRVTDPSRAALPGAVVTLVEADTHLARETTTQGDGGYRFLNVPPGSYTVEVRLEGFRLHVLTGVPVSANTVAREDVVLELGGLSETISVVSERTLLQTDTGDLHAELGSEEITRLPLGNYRNYQSALNLVPGTTPPRASNAITDTPARGLNINVNGTARNNNNTRLDGTSNVYVWLPHHTVYVAPAETIESVNISTASFDAEQGMAGGAAITVLTRSGTNTFHGSAFALHENEALRARDFFNAGEKGESSRNIDGLTLGGPILKDRLFFFGGWEGTFESVSHTLTGTVPTAALRAGDFSAIGTTIYDPATGNPDGSGRTPFPGNVIPADRISPIAAQIQSLVPLPNRDGSFSNYTATGPTKMNRHNFDFKLTYNTSSAAQVWAKYSQMNAEVTSDAFLGDAGGGGFGTLPGVGDTVVRLATVGTTWTLSPSFVLDGTIGMSRMDQDVVLPGFGTNFGTDVFGIPGTNGDGGSLGDPRTSGIPTFEIPGFSAYSRLDNFGPIFRNDRTYNVSLNSTWVSGDHELRFGADVVRLELNHWEAGGLASPRGGFTFPGGVTALGPRASPDPFNGYAQFLLGLTSTAGKSLQPELMTGREWQLGFYFRDRWQVTSDLTLNLGLRWERYPLMTRADRGIELYDETTNQVLLGGLGGNPEHLGIEVKHPQLLPRIGFAWRLGESDVIRGGYGITVSPIPLSRPLRGFFPFLIAETFVSASPFVPFGTLEEGIPLFFAPDQTSGSVELPPTAQMGSPHAGRITRGYVQSWNLTWERRLPWDFSLATSYVGTQTTHQIGFRDVNAAGAGEGRSGQPLFEAFGRSAPTLLLDGWLSSNYHSLQVALNRPFSDGFFVKGAYTWSKAMNRTDDDGWSSVAWNHPSVLDKNYGPAGHDRTHIFQLGFVAELPFGGDGPGVLNAIVRDWSLSGIVSAASGVPIPITASGASVNAPGNLQTPDRVGPIVRLGGIGRDDPYYDPSAWALVTEARFGDVGRNTLRGPGRWNLDLGLSRRFPVGRFDVEARAEAFNLTNTPHFGAPNRNANSPAFMTITSTDPNATERQFRLGLRLSF